MQVLRYHVRDPHLVHIVKLLKEAGCPLRNTVLVRETHLASCFQILKEKLLAEVMRMEGRLRTHLVQEGNYVCRQLWKSSQEHAQLPAVYLRSQSHTLLLHVLPLLRKHAPLHRLAHPLKGISMIT